MLAVIALFFPAAIMVAVDRWVFKNKSYLEVLMLKYAGSALLLNFIVICIARFLFGNRGNIVSNINTYHNFAFKYVLLATFLAVVIPLFCRVVSRQVAGRCPFSCGERNDADKAGKIGEVNIAQSSAANSFSDLKDIISRNRNVIGIVVIVLVLLVSVPSVFDVKETGLDPSWSYALNMLFSRGYTWGSDVVFTYGPLGFLVICKNEGINIFLAAVFWAAILCVHAVLLYQCIFKRIEDMHLPALLLGLFIFVITNGLAEYYLSYLALFAFFLAMKGFRKDIYFFAAILIVGSCIKFTIFMLLLAVALFYLIFGYFLDKQNFRYLSIRVAAGIVVSPLMYFAVSGFSISNYVKYIKGSLEVSSGYTVAMSTDANDALVFWVIAAVFAFLLCLAVAFKSNKQNFLILMLAAICLFMCYKHGFVRADDSHITYAMTNMLYFLSLAIMFVDWSQLNAIPKESKRIFVTAFSAVVIIALTQNQLVSLNIFETMYDRVLSLAQTMSDIYEQDDEELNPLPESFTEMIGDSTVAIYPWEISYCASNDLNYVPLYGVQAYSIYTTYLDEKTAEQFLDDDAPEYIIFSLDTIDGRWPLLECPQIWEAIKNNYYIAAQSDSLYLLKHISETSEVSYASLGGEEVNTADTIYLSEETVYVKISAETNLKGKLAKIFWKIPEVDMVVTYEDGTQETKRILLEQLSEGVTLGNIIYDSSTFIDLMNDTGYLSEVASISFEGDGLSYYCASLSVEYFSVEGGRETSLNEDITTGYAEAITDEDFSEYTIVSGSLKYCIDTTIGNTDYTKLVGWAYVEGMEENAQFGQICVEVGGEYYACTETERSDVQDVFSLSSDRVGYSILYASDEEATVCVIDRVNKIIYE